MYPVLSSCIRIGWSCKKNSVASGSSRFRLVHANLSRKTQLPRSCYKYRSRNSVNHHPKHGALAPNYPYSCAVTVRPPSPVISLHFLLNQFHAFQFSFDFLGVTLYNAISLPTTNHKMKVCECHCISETLLPPRTMTAEPNGVTTLHHCKDIRACPYHWPPLRHLLEKDTAFPERAIAPSISTS